MKYLKESFCYLLISESIVIISLLITRVSNEYTMMNLFISSYKIIFGVFLFWCLLNILYLICSWYINNYKKYQNVC
jgi:hypothetical protein